MADTKVTGTVLSVSKEENVGKSTKRSVVIKEDGEYGQELEVSFWGDKTSKLNGVNSGDSVSVEANVRGFKTKDGKLFTNLQGWKITKEGSQSSSSKKKDDEESEDQLPF